MKRHPLQVLILGFLVFSGAQNRLHAQIASGTIVGTAYDQSGAIVGGAEIVLTNMQTQLRRAVVTSVAGGRL